jgi:hypothetical protein
MLVMRTTKDPAYPIRQLISSQQPLGLNHFPLAINPFGLYGVEPRTLLGQKATHNPHPLAALLNPAVVFAEPASDLPGGVPTGVVPDENQHFLADLFELLQAPLKKLGSRMSATSHRVGAHRARSRRWLWARDRL